MSPVKVIVVGTGEFAIRAFRSLVARSDITVGLLPDAVAAATIIGLSSPDIAPDVIVLESSCLASPDRCSLSALMSLAPVLLLGTCPDPDTVLEGLSLGARGHVDWPREAEGRLESAIWTVLAGHPALSPLITLRVLDRLHEAAPATPEAPDPRLPRPASTEAAPVGRPRGGGA